MKNDYRSRNHPAWWAFLLHRLSGLALSVFLVEFAPALRQPDMGSGAEIAVDWPEPPAQPATQDEVLMSLAEAENGI